MSPSRARHLSESPAAPESELLLLRRLASERALGRKERPTTVHLLAVLCGREGPAQELLAARRLDEATLLKAGRTFDEQLSDPIGRALSAARVLGRRTGMPAARGPQRGVQAGALHVLIALLSDRQLAAYRALAQCGVDIARLRAESIEHAHGRPATTHDDSRLAELVAVPARSSARPTPSPASSRRPTATAVTLTPQPPSDARSAATRSTAPPAAEAVPLVASAAQAREASPRDASDPHAPGAHAPAPPIVVASTATLARSHGSAVAVPLSELAQSRLPPARGRARRPATAACADTRALELDASTQPLLHALGRNLTLAAATGEADAVVGRDGEIERALDVLAKRHAHNPLLVGPAGVGKTSVARGLAARLAEETPTPRILVELSPAALLAGTQGRGALAERLAAVVEEVRRSAGRIVLFVDDLDELVAGGADEVAGELKTALASGAFALVGATTPAGHRRAIESDAALCRRFSVIDVEEPDVTSACAMLRAAAEGLERHHGLGYPEALLRAASEWSARFVTGRALPDKAVAVLDLAGARARRALDRATPPASGSSRSRPRAVSDADVAAVVSEMSGVPVERLLETDGERMLRLERDLGRRVIGHADALGRIARILRRNAAGLRGARPIGSFLLLGPTGVGKTETAKAIAAALFHSADAMTRIDLSEYAESHALARLIGAPPGYVGHEAGGALTEAVRRRPYQVVLLDEIEKAHRDVLETFLQVLDEGRLTDGRGRSVDFKSTVIVLTSNLGAGEMRAARHEKRVGFGAVRPATSEPGDDGPEATERQRKIALEAARAALPPELYNRLDEVLVYRALAHADVATIADKLLSELAARLGERAIELAVGPGVVDALLAAGGFDPELGARPMRRTIARLVEAPLAELILQGRLGRGATASVRVVAGEIAVGADA
ncbi:MAG: AAA family ATPase [Myxococcales bacterium]|nr:AAA family ATPase [Myxococcales bacterium]